MDERRAEVIMQRTDKQGPEKSHKKNKRTNGQTEGGGNTAEGW